MERIKSLNRYQKGILIALTVMAAVFALVYARTIARVGFLYRDALLLPSQEAGSTVYSGKLQGLPASFTVAPDGAVTFQYGETTYGPYTAREDPTAMPEGLHYGELMTGVELRKGDEIVFRGGMLDAEEFCWLYNEDGEVENFTISVVSSYGIVTDENGQVIDPMEPSAVTILELMAGPKLTHRGEWGMWFLGLFLSIVTAISMLFADELFYLEMMFRVRDPEQAEPSEFQIFGRYISWTVLPLLALVVFATGLQ